MSGPPSGADGFPDTVAEIVTSLEQDPILLEEVMGNGHTDALDAALQAKAADAEIPVFVVYTVTPSGMSGDSVDEELASLVHAQLGRDGVYVVHTTEGIGHVQAWGDIYPGREDDADAFRAATSRASNDVRDLVKDAHDDSTFVAPVAEAGFALDVAGLGGGSSDTASIEVPREELTGYTQSMWVEASGPDWSDVEPPDENTPVVIATCAALVAFAVCYRLLRAVAAVAGAGGVRRTKGAGRSRPERDSVSDLDLARTRATRELEKLERSLSQPQARTQVDPERADLAENSHRVGTGLLGSDDRLDLLGALVLARTGNRALAKDHDATYRCCYLNPEHGESTTRTAVGSGLSVPVCGRCAKDLRRGKSPDALIEARPFAIDKPYHEGRSVWAETGFGALVDDLWRAVEERDRR